MTQVSGSLGSGTHGDPEHPLSVFGKARSRSGGQSVAVFQEGVASANVSEDCNNSPVGALLGHLGMILFFIYDESKGSRERHKLVDGILDLRLSL